MGKHVKEYYTCDRCGVEMDQPVRGAERGPTAFSLNVSQDHGVAGGPLIAWNELCGPCNSYVGELIRGLLDEQKNARAALQQDNPEPPEAG